MQVSDETDGGWQVGQEDKAELVMFGFDVLDGFVDLGSQDRGFWVKQVPVWS